MDGQILNTITEWDTVPTDDGSAGLATLADREFSGAVTDGVAWLFFLNGRGVGVVDGSVDDFSDAELTARKAPDDSLPLLYAMMSNGTDTRAKYYTEETPLSAAHETLESGGFTGFVELSENVLSGDYYVVYYGGRALPVAYVGASRKLLTGDEAFERADDEVGIYHVKEATVSVLDLPTGEAAGASDRSEQTETTFAVDTDDGADAAADADAEEAVNAADDGTDASGPEFDATAALGGDASDDAGDASDDAERDDAGAAGTPGEPAESTASTASEGAPSDDGDGTSEPAASGESDAREEPETDTAAGGEDAVEVADAEGTAAVEADGTAEGASPVESSTSDDAEDDDTEDDGDEAPEEPTATNAADAAAADGEDRASEVTFGGDDTGGTAAGSAADADADADADAGPDPLDDESVFDEEAEWRETQIIPPLSPDDEEIMEAQGANAPDRQSASSRTRRADRKEADSERGAALTELRERLERAEAERDETAERVAAVEAERDELAAERDELREERDELREEAERLGERVESLEAEVERLEEAVERVENTGGEQGSTAMSAESALSGTSLFVRYDTKGGATLEKARDGDADKETVNGNLRLEYHTTFDSDPVTVDGVDFESFLYDTTEYEFVRWLVEEFIYELQDTGNTGSMQELYDVLPEIDRVEFSGSVSLRYDENGEEHREQRTFDVVVRDRMGNALAVADINASREATTEKELASLVSGTKRLGETTETVAAAFSVTASFFDPAALEVAAEETKSGLLGRSKGKSYVKLSRKSGFHLVLVESRHGQFHVNVPEL